ncbi:MerR family transcriptional regulator [Paenibacillus pinisoli]|uniref:MerR family transcriptional regulator n=1 Tax=Paenibacillus pinisoli TaxID=1276110 RepID=A0A3A6PTG9_9BACL|nr:MerR family transcriptional regulator [Paenibacillus pinisoli]RJX39981.1 MerR family transcriptional regulator [Paenibacillus pinisoli]
MKINEVAKLTGLPISTLRFYERKNIIPDKFVQRDEHNYRVYSEEIVDFLDDVKTLLSVNFSIEEISLLVNQELNLSYEAKKKSVEQKIKELEDIQKQLKKSKAFLHAVLDGTANFQTKC